FNGGTIFDLFVYPFVLLFLFVGFFDDFDQQFWWYNHHAVVVADDNIAWLYGGATASNGAIHFPWDVTATYNGRAIAVGIDRNINIEHGRGIPDATVGDNGVGTAYFGPHGQNISERSGALFAAGFHDHDVVLLDRVHGLFLCVESATVFFEQVFAVWHIAQGLGEAENLATRVHRGW